MSSKVVTFEEAQAQLLELLLAVGQSEEIVITTEDNKPLARLIAPLKSSRLRTIGEYIDIIEIKDNFDAPLV
jgi:antitoxin (DNA-binding transcriptional repressor) of toxin-antitoxin stability system